MLPGVKGIRNAHDLLLARAVDEPFRFQAGWAVIASLLSSEPVSM
jgi:hypothetical protein